MAAMSEGVEEKAPNHKRQTSKPEKQRMEAVRVLDLDLLPSASSWDPGIGRFLAADCCAMSATSSVTAGPVGTLRMVMLAALDPHQALT